MPMCIVHMCAVLNLFFFFFLGVSLAFLVVLSSVLFLFFNFFLKCPCIFFFNKKMLIFCFIYRDIIVNLYHFIFHPFIFLLNQTYKFSISPLFHPPN